MSSPICEKVGRITQIFVKGKLGEGDDIDPKALGIRNADKSALGKMPCVVYWEGIYRIGHTPYDRADECEAAGTNGPCTYINYCKSYSARGRDPGALVDAF